MIKENNGWFCTAPDCMQYCKKESDMKFNFIQAVWLDTCGDDKRAENAKDDSDNYAVCAGSIDINDYTEIEIETSVSSYGYSLDELYGSKEFFNEDYNEIIAECLFEDNCLFDNHSIAGVVSWNDAEKTIQKYINEN